MGNKPGASPAQSSKGLKPVKSSKKATKILGDQALDCLRQDWAKVKGLPEDQIDFKTTSVDIKEFKALMNPEMKVSEVEALFNLYDCDHNGSITWPEYICVITLIMAGSFKDKIKLIFNTFDSDRNGSLSKDEFITAAKRFSVVGNDDEQAIAAYAGKIFAACDKNNDGSVSYKEFTTWVTESPQDFEKFAGVLNILSEQES